MRLSVWIIKKWLSSYSPVSTIVEGEQRIKGVRFFLDSTAHDTKYIYISTAYDFSESSNANEIFLINGNDVISLYHDDIEEVFNDTMAAFEYYNNWENALLFAANSKTNPEQKIIDLCKGHLGPIAILDLNFSVIAYSNHFGLGEVNQIYDEFILYNNPSLSSLEAFRKTQLYAHMAFKHDCAIIEEYSVAAKPYIYAILASYCDDDGSLLAQMIISSVNSITPFEVHLAKTIEIALNSIPNKTVNVKLNKYISGILLNSYKEGDLREYDKKKIILMQGWREEDNFVALSSRLSFRDEEGVYQELLSAYSKRLDMLLPGSISFVGDDSIISCICKRELHYDLEQHVDEICQQLNLILGVSYEFTNLSDFNIAVRQSQDAIRYRGNNQISYFINCALFVLAHERDREYCLGCTHPVINRLIEEDAQNGTDNAKTLRVFLQSERSYVLAAKRMYVHRNTIFYRIGKIIEAYPIDLDDSYTREYLLFSYRVLD